MTKFAYVDWPLASEGWCYTEGIIDRRVGFTPKTHSAVLFITLTNGQKICLTLPLAELNAAVAQINADPATRIAVIDGGKG